MRNTHKPLPSFSTHEAIGELVSVQPDMVQLTADVAIAYFSHNNVGPDKIVDVISSINSGLRISAMMDEHTQTLERPEPAVSIRASIKPDYIVCLEDGKKLKMLKRHLMAHYNLTPDEYRKRWDLPADYPMVAPNYAQKRRALALGIGLGRKSTEKAVKRG